MKILTDWRARREGVEPLRVIDDDAPLSHADPDIVTETVVGEAADDSMSVSYDTGSDGEDASVVGSFSSVSPESASSPAQ